MFRIPFYLTSILMYVIILIETLLYFFLIFRGFGNILLSTIYLTIRSALDLSLYHILFLGYEAVCFPAMTIYNYRQMEERKEFL